MSETILDQQERLIKENQSLVFYLVGRVFPSLPVRHEYDDLVGYGMLGLIEAAKAYRPSNDTKFSTFAFYRIRGAIYDGISESSWMSRAQYRRHMAILSKDQNRRQSANDRQDDGSDCEDSVAREGWDHARSDIVALTQEQEAKLENNEDSVSLTVVRQETESLLCQAISKLPDRENQLITMIYFEGSSLQEVADRIGISKSWASRVHQKIIEHLAIEMNRPRYEKTTQPNDIEED
jgi:RNA polymerase sigma factor for flagellar operon FliA